MKAVKFLNNYAPYKKGEIAGVDDSLAKILIDKKFAVAYSKDEVETTAFDSAPIDKQIKKPRRKKGK